jgi:hypothetical protein
LELVSELYVHDDWRSIVTDFGQMLLL